ncbi:unnamed protein product [Lactuca virosa]|uniref:Uncharacterized protein n=1 Tax=Lactuca virosa TaxID=75947 RepID=A0AAU9M4U7_9ASTR|nr:unnamed protein product [Lactuca virosa]
MKKSRLEKDPEEEMEEEPEEDSKEDMDEDIMAVEIMKTDSESSTTPPLTPSRSFLGFSFPCARNTDRISVPGRKPPTRKPNKRYSYIQRRTDQPAWESNQVNQ